MIGKHKDRVTISGRAANVADGYGGVSETYTTKWTGFAEVKKTNGNKAIEAGAVSLGSTYDFVLRKNPSISFIKTDKIVWDSKTFGIVTINSDEDRFLTITASCTE